jgi:hypothetical protein
MAGELPFLSRWSRRKVEARQGSADVPVEGAVPAPSPPVPAAAEAAPAEPLPAIESLTPESDFLPFLKPGVDEDLKRQALRTLFRDPQFNIMDGLDIYTGDYSQPDPIPPEMLARLNQLSHLGYREREPGPDAEEAQALPAPAGGDTAAAVPPEAVTVVAEDTAPPEAKSGEGDETATR